jgi:hypothetical protein
LLKNSFLILRIVLRLHPLKHATASHSSVRWRGNPLGLSANPRSQFQGSTGPCSKVPWCSRKKETG